MAKIRYIVPALLSAAVSLYALSAFSGQIASPAPQTITLNAAPIDLAVKQAPNRHVSMKYLPRRFANPTLLGKVKADLAAEAKSVAPARTRSAIGAALEIGARFCDKSWSRALVGALPEAAVYENRIADGVSRGDRAAR